MRSRDLWAHLSSAASGILIVLGSVAAFVPFAPSYPVIGLDGGWQFGVNAAVARGLIFGRDITFTFGPYGATYDTQYHPATDTQMLWSAGLLAVAFAAGLICASRSRYRLAAILLATCLLATPYFTRDALFFGIPLVFLVLVCRIAMADDHPAHLPATAQVRLSLALLVVALSLLPLIKGTFGIAAVAVMGLAWLLLMLRAHKALATGGVSLFLLAMPAFWAIAHQPLARLPGYFIAQWPIMSGYSDAMSLVGNVWEPVVYIVGCVLLGCLHVRLLRSAGLPGLVLAAGAVFLLFLGFKAGFVRHDGHAAISAGTISLASWILMVGFRGIRPMVGAVVGLACWAAIVQNYTSLSLPAAFDGAKYSRLGSARGVVARIAGGGELQERYAASLSAIRAQQKLPALEGPTDIYSSGQSILLAYGFEWAPRFVLQGYSAYTTGLLRQDAHHLDGPQAPENVLFSIEPIDGRLPPLEDGPSWPALLSRYEATGLYGSIAILHRRQEPTALRLVLEPPLSSGLFAMDQEIPLPADGQPLWARIAIKPTLLGRIAEAAYKLPRLTITFRFPGGRVQRFRYIAGMGEAGFVISPLVQSTADFIALELPDARAYFSAQTPQSISVSGDGGTRWLWEKSLALQVFALDIPAQPQVGRLLFDRMVTTESVGAASAKPPVAQDCIVDSINRHQAESSNQVGRYLRVEGWAAISVKDGIAPDATTVTLVGADGTMHRILARITPRDDVNRYFQKPQMGQVGYAASADLSGLAGQYTLGLELSLKGKTWNCALQLPITIAGRSAGAG